MELLVRRIDTDAEVIITSPSNTIAATIRSNEPSNTNRRGRALERANASVAAFMIAALAPPRRRHRRDANNAKHVEARARRRQQDRFAAPRGARRALHRIMHVARELERRHALKRGGEDLRIRADEHDVPRALPRSALARGAKPDPCLARRRSAQANRPCQRPPPALAPTLVPLESST